MMHKIAAMQATTSTHARKSPPQLHKLIYYTCKLYPNNCCNILQQKNTSHYCEWDLQSRKI